jgi:hypothetical protein
MPIEEQIEELMNQHQWEYFKIMKEEAESILKELTSLTALDKFKIEDIIQKAKVHLGGGNITQVDSVEL